MSRNIKIKFITKAPAGYETGDIDFCSEFQLKKWQEAGEYEVEVIDNPNTKAAAPKKTNKPNKPKKKKK